MLPNDVPLHRPSVGAMGWMGAQVEERPFKPYVYRGWGIDLLEDPPSVTPWREPEPPQCKAARRRTTPPPPISRPRRMPVAPTPDEDVLVAEAAAREARALLAALDREQSKPKCKKDKKSKRKKDEKPKRPKPKSVSRNRPIRPIRPSPGWKPMTGADILAGLEE